MSSERRAVVRGIPDSFVNATVTVASKSPIDVARARMQHDSYTRALERFGVELIRLDADETLPDCVFVEDQAVIAGGAALIARSGNPKRRAEASVVAAALGKHMELRIMVPAACLDGGDVLRVGDTLFVGRSKRTNAAGIGALREAFEHRGLAVVEVDVPDALHLKCYCSSPAPGVILVADGRLPLAPFEAVARVVRVPADEAYAANTVGVGGSVIVAAGYPVTAAALSAEGLSVVAIDTSEIAKADGSLTCMSLLF